MATKKTDDADQAKFFDPRGGAAATKQAALAAKGAAAEQPNQHSQ